jgi:uncharacterized protein YecE (DUF72 family)
MVTCIGTSGWSYDHWEPELYPASSSGPGPAGPLRRTLLSPEAWAQRIAAWHELAGKRAVLLVPLAPAQPRDDARLAYFLPALPGWVRVAVEFRHPSWHHAAYSADDRRIPGSLRGSRSME